MIDAYYHYHYNACDKDDTSSNNDNSNDGNDDDNVAGVDNVDDDVQSKLQFIRILGWETLVNSPHQVRLKNKTYFCISRAGLSFFFPIVLQWFLVTVSV